MKTEFSEFCQRLGGVVSPYHSALKEALEGIDGKPDADALKPVTGALAEVLLRLQTLEEKVAGQQAYVSIFGPLKSGKSTLMNAISGSYVSEITSLPAYPCLVYVKDGPQQKFLLTSYNGNRKSFRDSQEMQRVLEEGHVTLADRIRQAEERGEVFEPAIHYPEAIRRVDVELPAPSLKDSLTILVDTPGLYSRMKFGYELMTREFRDSAACAVFVVKTDNLFLEQVFAEFNDLLGLFSRIFLVVNLDSSKLDIGPDGQLHPSLESRNPERIIRAFESLSMSAPLRQAADEGRLKIYPIDLLHAALDRLSHSPDEVEGGEGADSEEAGSEGEAVGEDISPVQQEASAMFGRFLGDLTDYLNSNDYLHEFMGDSLRQARNLSQEVQEWCQPERRESFELRQKNLRLQLTSADNSLAELKAFTGSDTASGFERIREGMRSRVQELGRESRSGLSDEFGKQTNSWWETDESLKDLETKGANDPLKRQLDSVTSNLHETLDSMLESKTGGLKLTPTQSRFLEQVKLPLEEVRREALESVKDFVLSFEQNRFSFQEEKIPVRKGVFDWIFFRGLSSVRRRLLGEPDALDRPLSPGKKRSRLGDIGREALQTQVDGHLEKVCGVALHEYADALLQRYSDKFQESLRTRLESLAQSLEAEIKDCRQRLDINARIEAGFHELIERTQSTGGHLRDLASQYGYTLLLETDEEGGAEEPEEEAEDEEDV